MKERDSQNGLFVNQHIIAHMQLFVKFTRPFLQEFRIGPAQEIKKAGYGSRTRLLSLGS